MKVQGLPKEEIPVTLGSSRHTERAGLMLMLETKGHLHQDLSFFF